MIYIIPTIIYDVGWEQNKSRNQMIVFATAVSKNIKATL